MGFTQSVIHLTRKHEALGLSQSLFCMRRKEEDMLTETDLLSKNNISNISEVSLKLYLQFFRNHICPKLFIYTSVDGTVIKLMFDENNFMHLLGAQHILGDKYKSTKFNKGIDNASMTFEELDRRDPIEFRGTIDRFVGFGNIYSVLTNCSAVYFDASIYNAQLKKKSTMDFKYLLFEDIFGQKVHVGIDTYNKGKTFFGKSVLVSSIQNDKLIKGQTKLDIKKIEIVDKRTKSVLQTIDIAQPTPEPAEVKEPVESTTDNSKLSVVEPVAIGNTGSGE